MSDREPAPWSRAALTSASRRLLSRGSRLKPAVWRVETEAGPVALLDCAGLPAPGRALARWLLRRERRALERLAGLPEFPQVLAVPDRDAVVLSWLDGRPLDRETFAADPHDLAGQLRRLVDQMHAHRVFHLDLRQRRNLLVDGAGRLRCLDFGASWAPGPIGAALFGPILRRVDRSAVRKYLARYAPEELSEEEARAVLRGLVWRRLWIFSPYRERGEGEGARRRLGRG
ncbi:MAG: hypothetical protein D6702_08970 [Planctomycetota bacterium]|nr:MAG: hypothetical protein D6702_08970 [Planctomycetota bacterium]